MFNTVYIDDVFVPDESVLGEVEPRLGGQPQHPDRRAGVDRQQRPDFLATLPSLSTSCATASSTRSPSIERAS